MAFVQLVELRTSDVDAIMALDREWEEATQGKRTTRRSIVTRDRNDPDRYVVIVFFDSHESAMQNSELPETQQFAERFAEHTTAPPVFHDLDVIEDRES